jgi:ATP-dependent RNA helicase SUPV3L1/SUV3
LHTPDLTLIDKFTFSCAPASVDTNFENEFFVQCLKSVAKNVFQLLPPSPNWLVPGNSKRHNAKHLEEAEVLSQNVSLYAWLSYQYPNLFIDGEKIKAFRSQISDYIAAALLTQAGFLETTREIKATPVWRRNR